MVEDDEKQEREVTTGLRTSTQVEILAGLTEGEKITLVEEE
jgi:multidrug efflux pump subunit AcrA (membrane-fusion protein)